MCHFDHMDMERHEAELRRQASDLLKRADAIREQRQAMTEKADRVRRQLEETAFV